MCIAVWTIEHPDYALILGTNRDEFLDRPTQEAHFHSFQKSPLDSSSVSGQVLSGRDVKAGGSWLGLNRAGRIALLTNITEPPKSFTSSRGYLVSSFLLSDSSSPLEDELGKIVSPDAEFAGFNLLLLAPTPGSISTIPIETRPSEGRGQGLEPRTEEAILNPREQKLSYDAILVTNHGAGGRLESRRLISAERACGCMSNGIDGQGGNEWPKVKRTSSSFGEVLKGIHTDNTSLSAENELVEKLFDILTWHSPDPVTERGQLRNTVQVTPIPIILKASGAKAKSIHSDPSTPAVAPPPASVSSPGTSDSSAQPTSPIAPGFENYYGTRLSTVVLIRRDGSVLFIERDIWRLGRGGKPERVNHSERQGEGEVKERIFEFTLDRKGSL